MIRKQQDIIKEVDGKLTTIGTVYMKKHRIVVELDGYKFKTTRTKDEEALHDQYKEILHFLNLDDHQGGSVIFFRDKNRSLNMLRAVISPNLVVTSSDLGWEDDTHTLKDLHAYYKEVSERKLI